MSSSDQSDWMGQLLEGEPTLDHPITSLRIPGSHNSFTNNLYPDLGIGPDRHPLLKWVCHHFGCIAKPIVQKWCQCQDMSASQQLKAGVRYFDFRLGIYKPPVTSSSAGGPVTSPSKTAGNRIKGSPDSVGGGRQMRVLHALYGDPLGPILSDIHEFLSLHSREIVILDFQHVYDFKSTDHEALVDKLFKTFGSKLCPIHENVSNLTLEDMVDKNKRVIVIYPSMAKVYSTLWPRYLCPNPWADTTNANQLIRFLDDNLAHRNTCRLFVSQAVLTPSQKTVVANLFSSLRNTLAKTCDECVAKWIRNLLQLQLQGGSGGGGQLNSGSKSQNEGDSRELNIVIVDFVENEQILDAVIALNKV